jgi:hypothetical protein
MINIVFVLIYAILGNIISPNLLLIIFSTQCFILLIPYFNQKKIEITPLSLYLIGLLIVNLANYLLIGNVGTLRNKTYKYIIPEYINLATQIWCISGSFIIMGYQYALNKSFPSVELIVKKANTLQTIFYSLLVINVLQLMGIRLFNISQIVKFIGLANLIGILFFARLAAKTKNSNYQIYTVILFIVQTYIALFYSYLRINLILPTLVLFLGYFIGKEDTKYIFSYRIIPFVVLFGLYASVFKTLGQSRSNFYYAFATTLNSSNNNNYNNAISNDNSDDVQGATYGGSDKTALLDRSANLAQMTCVVDLVKRNGFYNGSASAPLVIALVPRFLWPDKPKIELGRWFALEIGVAYKSEDGNINNSINMTVPGELYLDFGWIGVVLGSLLIGAFIAVLWNATHFYSSEYNIVGILYGGYLLFLCFIGIGVDLQVVITLISTYLSFYFVKKIAKAL